jgi:hypothetical protein
MNLLAQFVLRGIMAESLASGRAGLLFAGSPVPRREMTDPANAQHSQFEPVAVIGEQFASLVGSRHSVNARAKLTGRLLVKAAEIPGNGLLMDAAINAYVPVVENKAYLTSGREARVKSSLNL